MAIRPGRFTGGKFRPTAQDVAAEGSRQIEEENQQATIAPSGQGTLPSQQAPTSGLTPGEQTLTDIAADVAAPRPNSLLALADSFSSAPAVSLGRPDTAPPESVIQLGNDANITNLQDRTRFNATQGRTGQVSPEAADVTGVAVPVAGSLIGSPEAGVGATTEGAFETEQERQERYSTEQIRQNLPGAAKFEEAIQGLGEDGQSAFDAHSTELSIQLQDFALKEPKARNALVNAGVLDPDLGIISTESARSLLFVMASQANEAQKTQEAHLQTISQRVDNGELSEADADQAILDEANNDYNLRGSTVQSNVASQFAQLMGVDQVADAQGRVDNPEAIRSPIAGTEEGSILGVTTAEALVNMGFLEPKDTLDPDTGRPVKDYSIAGDFFETLQSIGSVLDEFSPGFRKDVTFTPNRGGAPSGLAGLYHKETTKSPTNKTGIKKGSEVWQANDAMGTTANGINTQHLGTTLGILQNIRDHKTDQIAKAGQWAQYSFSEHPLAEMFQLGKTSWMRGLNTVIANAPPGTPIEILNISKFDSAPGNEGATIVKNGQTYYTGFQQVAKNAQNQIAQGINVNYNNDLLARLVEFRTAANKQHNLLSSSALRAAMEGTRLNGSSFYHTYTPHAGTSRPMVATTTFNHHSNKMARGLQSNPRPTAINFTSKGRDNTDVRAWKAIIARNLHHRADKAVNHDHLVDMFSEITSDMNTMKLSRAVYNATRQNTPQSISQTAKNITQERAGRERGSDLPGLQGNFPNLGMAFNVDPETMNLLAKELELVDADGNPTKSDEVHYKLMALRDLGEYLVKTDNGKRPGVIATQIKAEVDGISNGVIIQAYQFADSEVLKRGGVLYGPEGAKAGNIIPKGNIRDFLHDTIMEGLTNNAVSMNTVEAKKWTDAYKAVFEPAGEANSSAIKALHKIPVMTTPYGLDPNFHHGSIKKFLNDPQHSEYKSKLLQITGSDEKTLVDTMALMEGAALKAGLSGVIKHQAVIKNAANAAIVAGKLLSVKGPNGWDVVSGGIVREETGQTSLNLNGENQTDIYISKSFGTPYASKTYDDENGIKTNAADFEVEGAPAALGTPRKKRSKVGTKLRNQSAVAGTQNIDATVAQRTFVKSKEAIGDKFWGSQIYDAFEGDVSSFQTMMDTANSEFDSVNKEYSLIQAEIDAVHNIRKEVMKDVAIAKKNNLKFDVTENGAYKGMYDVLQHLSQERTGAYNKELLAAKPGFSDRQLIIKRLTSKDIGWKAGGVQMTPDQFVKAYDYVIKQLEIESSLRRLKADVQSKRSKLDMELAEQRKLGLRTRQFT